MKKILVRKAGIIILIVLIVMAAGFLVLNINDYRTIKSLKKVDNYPLYFMKYYGEYHFDFSIHDNKNQNNQESVYQSKADNNFNMMCSAFIAKNEKGEYIFCRNLDYALDKHPITVLMTDAPGKNASLTMADLFYLGFNQKNPPSNSILKAKGLMATPRVTIDGMNEYGLSIAILSVPKAEAPYDSNKQSMDEVAMNRIILDGAKTVDEAIDILMQYNIIFKQGAAHFMIADASGASAIIEFIDGDIKVTKNNQPWQVCTNFVVAEDLYDKEGKDRYDKAESKLSKTNGILTETEAMNLLADISQDGTIWSVIYNLTSGEAKIVMGKNYSKINKFHMKMKK